MPLADKIRPSGFDDIVGQSHLFGREKGAVRRMIDQGYLTNMVFFGPPGTGKTTAANIIAKGSGMKLYKLNATSATIADIKDITAQTDNIFAANGILLYLDEIQYFNKKQQQSLLEYMEDGRITLIASTTENPYLYVYAAILSRSAVFEFYAVTPSDIVPALKRGLDFLNRENSTAVIPEDGFWDYISHICAGDVRRGLNLLENAYFLAGTGGILQRSGLEAALPKIMGNFDKSGTVHYDLLSALQKSIRGSDPDAAIFYLAKILEGGDLAGACRRLQVVASEDVGLAYSNAAAVVRACVESAKDLGMPEAAIPLSHAAILLATSPKSNSACLAYAAAKADIETGKGQTIPPYMRPSNQYNGYKYPHDSPHHYVMQQYLPDDLKNTQYYRYGDNKTESSAKQYWDTVKKQ